MAMTIIDETEIAQFDALAAQWWDVNGPMAPLHRMNPVRLDYILAAIRAHHGTIKGLSILDVGCGGGLVTEPLARLGGVVTGIDGAADLLAVAAARAKAEGLRVTYEPVLTDALLKREKRFDVVLGLEVIEHVPDQQSFIAQLAALTKPNGLMIISTLNRTMRSLAFSVVAAEYILRWLPRGTHDWRHFVKPSQLLQWLDDAGARATDITGVVYRPIHRDFVLAKHDVAVNYLVTAVVS